MASSRGLYIITALALIYTGFARSDAIDDHPRDGVYAVAGVAGEYHIESESADSRNLIAISNLDLHRAEWVTIESSVAQPSELTRIDRLECDLAEYAVKHANERAASSALPARRKFCVHTGDGPFHDERFYTHVEAQLIGSTDVIAVYLHPHARTPQQAAIDELLQTSSTLLKDLEQRLSNSVQDLDSSGRFTILLVPPPAREEPIAFVRPGDFSLVKNATGNAADLMYLTCDIPEGPLLKAIFAHEFAHALRCSASRGRPEEDWLHEGIAHAVERSTTDSRQNTAHRIARYFEEPESYPLIVSDYFAAQRYRDHGCRGATISFMESLSLACDEDTLLSRLIGGRTSGLGNLENATGIKAAALIRRWTGSHLTSHPRLEEGFVLLGPRAASRWDGVTPLRLRIAPTATVFVEMPARSIATVGSQNDVLQVSVSKAKRIDGIELSARRDGSEVVVSAVPKRKGANRVVVGLELNGAQRNESLGYRDVAMSDNKAVEVRFSLQEVARPLAVKAFAEYADGSVSVGRTSIPVRFQLAGQLNGTR